MTPVAHVDISADGVVKAAGGELCAVLLTAGTGAAADITLYDNPSTNSGTVLCVVRALTGTSFAWVPPCSYVAGTGIYADINGTGANATVLYM